MVLQILQLDIFMNKVDAVVTVQMDCITHNVGDATQKRWCTVLFKGLELHLISLHFFRKMQNKYSDTLKHEWKWSI